MLNKNPAQFLERLLAQPSALELESRKTKTELNELLMESTTKERLEMERFKSVKSHVILFKKKLLINLLILDYQQKKKGSRVLSTRSQRRMFPVSFQ